MVEICRWPNASFSVSMMVCIETPSRPATSRSTWTFMPEAVVLRLGRDIAQQRRRLAAAASSRAAHSLDFLRVGAGERVLVLRAAQRGSKSGCPAPAGNRPRCRGWRRPASSSRSMTVGDRRLALVARPQRDGEPPGIGCGVERRHADHRHHAGHVRVLADRGLDLVLQPLHLGERDFLPAFRHGDDQAGVLLRQEALRDDDVEPDGRDQRVATVTSSVRVSWRSTHSRLRR